ncbi:hypothetical protein EJ07DRAFT_68636, partial [Lizonia empirigonia]
FHHPQQTASICKHDIHPSSPAHTPLCPQCVKSAARASHDKAQTRLEAEGGVDPPAYMRDRIWNVARLQYVVTKRRVEETMTRDQLRQKREELWEEQHQRYLAQYGLFPPDSSLLTACVACATIMEAHEVAKTQTSIPAMPWWERQGALVADKFLVPNTAPQPTTGRERRPKPKGKRPSYLRDLIRSYRKMTSVSDMHRREWGDRCKTERAVRRKYDLPENFEIDSEFFANPIPASHARHHHRQLQDRQYLGQRRTNRYMRRVEGYKPCRSPLALTELAVDVMLDELEVERLRLAEADAELQPLANVAATEVGYLYLVGDNDGLEDWRYDVERSNMSLVFR